MAHTVIFALRQSASDEFFRVVEIRQPTGSKVAEGECLLALEGAKTVVEIEAPRSGYVIWLCDIDDEIPVGSRIGVITDDPHLDPDTFREPHEPKVANAADLGAKEGGKKFTLSARNLLERHGLTFEDFSDYDEVTSADIEHHLGRQVGASTDEQRSAAASDDELIAVAPQIMERIAVLGAGRGAIQFIDIAALCPTQFITGFYDDLKAGTGATIAGLPVYGPIDVERIARDYENGLFDKVIISIGKSILMRSKWYEALSAKGVPFANLVHPRASIGLNSVMGTGNVVLADVLIGPCTIIGNDNFISAKCNLEHHVVMHDHNTFGPGVMTSGSVMIGSRIRFGTGIFIEPDVQVGDDAVVASGAVLTSNVPEGAVVKVSVATRVRKRT